MAETAAYVLATALLIIPLMMQWPIMLDILYHVFRMTTAAIGTPWP